MLEAKLMSSMSSSTLFCALLAGGWITLSWIDEGGALIDETFDTRSDLVSSFSEDYSISCSIPPSSCTCSFVMSVFASLTLLKAGVASFGLVSSSDDDRV